MLPAMLVTVATLLLDSVLATPVYNMQPAYITANIGSGRNIRHLPCISKKTKQSGVCMFAIDCVKSNGTHLGTCVDRFYFGSCCRINPQNDVIDNTIESSIIPTRKPPHTKIPLTTLFGVPSVSYTGASPTQAVTRPTYLVSSLSSSTINRIPSTTTEKLTSRITDIPLSSTGSTSKKPSKVPSKPSSTTTSKKPTKFSTTTHRNEIETTYYTQSNKGSYVTTEPQVPETTTEQSYKLSTFQSVENEPTIMTTFSTVAPTTVKAPTRPTKPPTRPISSTQRITLKPVTLKPPPKPASQHKNHTTGTKHTTLRPRPTTLPVSTLMASTTTSTKKPPVKTQRPTVKVPTSTLKPSTTVSSKPVKVTRPSTIKPSTKYPGVTTPTKITKRPTTAKVPSSTSYVSSTAHTTVHTTSPPKRATTTKANLTTTTTTTHRFSVTTQTPTTQRFTTQRPLSTSGGLTTWSSTSTINDITTKPPQTTTLQDASTEKIKPPYPTGAGTFVFSSTSSISPSSSTTTSNKPIKFPGEMATTTQRFSTITTSTTRTPTTPSRKSTTSTESSEESGYVPIKLNMTGLLEAVNGNPATNEIESSGRPTLQSIPSTEATTFAPQLVTWAVINDKTTMKPSENATDDGEWSPLTTPDGWILLPSLPTTNGLPSSTSASSSENDISSTLTGVQPTPSGAVFNTTVTLPPFLTSSTFTGTTMSRPSFPDNSNNASAPSTQPTTSAGGLNVATTTSYPPIVGPGGEYGGGDFNGSTSGYGSSNETSVRPPTGALNVTDYRDICGKRMFPQARIVGGERANYGDWPWQISLRQWRTSTYLHKCGAALLNENWAITAAHCVDNVPPSDLLLRLGEHDLSTEAEPYIHQERRVQIVASHPQFDPRTFEYDLALLRFYEPVQFQPNIIPVCVPENDENFVGKTAFVTGWGRLYEDGPLPGVLQQVRVPVINNTVCESMYRSAGYIEHIPHIFICAGWRKGGFDSCEGDSGGPMVIQRPDKRFLLAGVISWGIGCAEPNQPGVYTRISEFRDWINQILQF